MTRFLIDEERSACSLPCAQPARQPGPIASDTQHLRVAAGAASARLLLLAPAPAGERRRLAVDKAHHLGPELVERAHAEQAHRCRDLLLHDWDGGRAGRARVSLDSRRDSEQKEWDRTHS